MFLRSKGLNKQFKLLKSNTPFREYQDFEWFLFLAVSMPVVRNRAVIHMMDWFKNESTQLCDSSFYTLIQVTHNSNVLDFVMRRLIG